ncbi:hypothetical protein [Jeotgalibacillus marinus]|uniref:Uncharacterized protein n=1 Tax=Jeotgalibacillus marinus TaxID=86667 RepID=A0ABV3Q2W7_9BACL
MSDGIVMLTVGKSSSTLYRSCIRIASSANLELHQINSSHSSLIKRAVE